MQWCLCSGVWGFEGVVECEYQNGYTVEYDQGVSEHLPIVGLVVLWRAIVHTDIRSTYIVWESSGVIDFLAATRDLSANNDFRWLEFVLPCGPELILVRCDSLGEKGMLDSCAKLFQVSDNWQDVHDKETRNCTDKSQYATDLGVKYGDKGRDQKNSNIYWVEDFICDLLVFEE